MKLIQKNITPEARQALAIRDARRNVYQSVKKLIDLKCKNKTPTQAQKIITEVITDWLTKKANAKGQLQHKEYCAIVPYFFKKHAL